MVLTTFTTVESQWVKDKILKLLGNNCRKTVCRCCDRLAVINRPILTFVAIFVTEECFRWLSGSSDILLCVSVL